LQAQVAPREHFKFAKYSFDQGDYYKSLEHINKAIKSDTSYAGAYFLKASALYEIEKYEMSIDNVDKALSLVDEKSSVAAEYLILRGRGNVMMGKEKEALTDFNTSILTAGTNTTAFVERAALKKKSNDYRGAIADITYAIEISRPENAELYAIRADLLSDFYRPKSGSNEFEKVLGDINKAISLRSDCYDYYRFRSDFYLKTGEKEAAMDALTFMIERFPNRFEPYAKRGLLLLHSYQYAEAIKDFTNSIILNPEDEENYRYRALCYHNVSKYHDAFRDLSKSIDMLSERVGQVNYSKNTQITLAETYIQRGLCLTRMGNSSSSCADFLNALDLGVTKGKVYFRKFCESY
jgi:tetratricopeptide (TPR) repeat protein